MAISVAYQTVATVTAAAQVYTVPTSGNFGSYARDLVLTNSGTVTIYAGLTTAGSPTAATTSSFQVPTGGTVLLTQCQVPAGAVVSATAPTGTGSLSIGFASVVSVV